MANFQLHGLLLDELSGENDVHKCKMTSMKFREPRTGRTHMRDHTVSSFSKTTAHHAPNAKTPPRLGQGGSRWLRDLRQLQSILANTPEKPFN